MVNIFGVITGMTISVTSVMLPRLLEGEPGPMFDMKIDTDQSSYIGTSMEKISLADMI